MSLTHPQHAALLAEVEELACPSGVQKVFERDEHGFVLQLRGGGETSYVLVDTTQQWPRATLATGKPKQPPAPSAFVMLLRKHLIGCGLQGVTLTPTDRIAEFRFLRRSETGEQEFRLIAELFGAEPNVFLVNDLIVGAQHSGARLRPGEPYAAPAPGPEVAPEDPLSLGEVDVGGRAAALADWLADKIATTGAVETRKELAAALKREGKKARRLVKNLEGDLERAEAAQDFRRRGELLQSAYALEVPRGTESVAVPDYYADGAPKVEIALDPARSLKQNIARYFHEYRRMNAAIDSISERLLETLERVDAIDEARATLSGLDDAALDDFEARLRADGILVARRRQQRGRRQATAKQPSHRTFVARSGTRILVGRGAKHNDVLTTKTARGRDVWMHARDWAGAHVVLRMDRDSEPLSEDLRDAALLAAHFSKGREDSLVDVTYTRAKWVRKPKGAAPGLVTVAGGSTIGVQPDPERLRALFQTEVDS